jgi:hypothetical protein
MTNAANELNKWIKNNNQYAWRLSSKEGSVQTAEMIHSHCCHRVSKEGAVECDCDYYQRPTDSGRLASTCEGCWGWGFEARCCKAIVRLQGSSKDQAAAPPLGLPLPKSGPCRGLPVRRPTGDGHTSRPQTKPRPPEQGLLPWGCPLHSHPTLVQPLRQGRRWILWWARALVGVRRRLKARWSRTDHGTWRSHPAWWVVAAWHWKRCH